MKTIFQLLLISVFVLSCTNLRHNVSQKIKHYKPISEFNGDTLKYLNYNFIENKEKYIGEKFEVFLKDLKLNIKSNIRSNSYRGINTSDGISVSFYKGGESSFRMYNNLSLVILNFEWENQRVPDEITKKIDNEYGEWSKNHERYFGKQIIKDIHIVVFPDPKRTKAK